MRPLLVTIVAALALTSATTAMAAPPTWTPARMAQVAPSLPGPVVNIDGSARETFRAGIPTCVGIGTRVNGGFLGFRCSVAWRSGFLNKGTAPLWVRPLASGYCLSSSGFAGCPPSFRPDDPRACGRVVEACMVKAARTVTDRAIRASGRIAVNLLCGFRSALVARCEWLGGSATVTYTLGAAGWKPTVAFG